uniref:spermidine synthase n=1 Tax=Micrococcus sp. HSID17228 TaxID=2419507 RepID=UPI001575B074|nr:fused MFS/spermidine synthase [Micrococcus sp. HSID17228]
MPAQPSPSGRTVHLSTSGVDARIAPDEFGGFVLEIGGAVQSHVDLADPARIRYEYLRRMAHVLDGVAPAGAPVRVLHLGAGALTLPRYLQAIRPGSEQTVVDLDRELVSFVLAELPLPAGTDLVSVVADARLAAVDLAMDGERFDAVVLDIGTGEEGAEHLRGAVFHGELLELLTAGGVLLVNIGDDAGLRFLGAELGALEEAAAEAEAVLRLVGQLVWSRTDAEWAVLDLLVPGVRGQQKPAAAALGITAQAVSQAVQRSYWNEEHACRPAAARLLTLAGG